jgi:hypothetical protein
MSNIVKHFSLTPSQAAEKELILDQIRIIPRGPWVNGNKVTLPKSKASSPGSKKKK